MYRRLSSARMSGCDAVHAVIATVAAFLLDVSVHVAPTAQQMPHGASGIPQQLRPACLDAVLTCNDSSQVSHGAMCPPSYAHTAQQQSLSRFDFNIW